MRGTPERTAMIDEVRILLACVQGRAMLAHGEAQDLFVVRGALQYYRSQIDAGTGPIMTVMTIGTSVELLSRASTLLDKLAKDTACTRPQRQMLQSCVNRVRHIQEMCVKAGWVAQRHDWREMQLPVGDRT